MCCLDNSLLLLALVLLLVTLEILLALILVLALVLVLYIRSTQSVGLQKSKILIHNNLSLVNCTAYL